MNLLLTARIHLRSVRSQAILKKKGEEAQVFNQGMMAVVVYDESVTPLLLFQGSSV